MHDTSPLGHLPVIAAKHADRSGLHSSHGAESMQQTVLVALLLVTAWLAPAPPAQSAQAADPQAPRAEPARQPPPPQPRVHSRRIAVDPRLISVDDGDTVVIRWAEGDDEIVRILGIDTPETRHPEHNLPYAQPFGLEARAFAKGAFAAATDVQLLRAATLDPYTRTLGYFFLNGRNYSVLVVTARLAAESITPFGDNGFPDEAAEVLRAAKATGPLPFEPPHVFRARMRDVTRWMKSQGIDPAATP
jgi:micrococcal nuclease